MKWETDMTLGHQTQSTPVLVTLGDFIRNKEIKPYSTDLDNKNTELGIFCLFVCF